MPGFRLGGRAREGAPPPIPSSAIGSSVERKLAGGAERCRLGGGRASGSRPGGPSEPLAMAGVRG
eukprot:6705125-Alexandrium_andersonii.AAC.1